MSSISAIICTYNRENYILKALKSVSEQDLEKERFQLIIVNNNSTDRTEEICRGFINTHAELDIRYIDEPEQGLSAARNRGIKESSMDYLTFVDDDATLDQAFLRTTCDYLDKHTKVAAIGGKILLDYEEKPPAWENKFLNALLGYFDWGNKVRPFEPPRYPRGSNMSFRAAVFEEIGAFDTNLGRKGDSMEGNEEKELFARIFDRNYPVHYVPRAVVYHAVPPERTRREFIRNQAIGFGQSEKRYRRQHGGLATMRREELFKWLASLVLLFYYALTFRPSKGWMILSFRLWVGRGMRSEV